MHIWVSASDHCDHCHPPVYYLAESELQSHTFGYHFERDRCGRLHQHCRSTPSTFAAVSMWVNVAQYVYRLGNYHSDGRGWSYVQSPNCKLTTLRLSGNGLYVVESYVEALQVQSREHVT